MAPPSEFDLRAALRDGEGDGPDVNSVIFAGQARRAQRRSRIVSTAVVIGVVGGLGVSAAVFGGGSESGGSSADSGALHEAAGGLGAAPDVPQAARKALDQVSCPSAAPDYAPGAGAVGSSGSATDLFAHRVTSVVVCAYGTSLRDASQPALHPARLELAGHQAAKLADSLENAPAAAPSASCSSTSTEQYAIVPIDAAGNTGQPVAAELPSSACGALVTNGTAVRYGWKPPPGVAAKLEALSPARPPDSPAPAGASTTG